jgi:hypothetical protein
VCWSLGFSYNALHKYTSIWLTLYILNSDLLKFRRAPDISNVNTVFKRVSVDSRDVNLRASQHRGTWTPTYPQFQISVAAFRAHTLHE